MRWRSEKGCLLRRRPAPLQVSGGCGSNKAVSVREMSALSAVIVCWCVDFLIFRVLVPGEVVVVQLPRGRHRVVGE